MSDQYHVQLMEVMDNVFDQDDKFDPYFQFMSNQDAYVDNTNDCNLYVAKLVDS